MLRGRWPVWPCWSLPRGDVPKAGTVPTHLTLRRPPAASPTSARRRARRRGLRRRHRPQRVGPRSLPPVRLRHRRRRPRLDDERRHPGGGHRHRRHRPGARLHRHRAERARNHPELEQQPLPWSPRHGWPSTSASTSDACTSPGSPGRRRRPSGCGATARTSSPAPRPRPRATSVLQRRQPATIYVQGNNDVYVSAAAITATHQQLRDDLRLDPGVLVGQGDLYRHTAVPEPRPRARPASSTLIHGYSTPSINGHGVFGPVDPAQLLRGASSRRRSPTARSSWTSSSTNADAAPQVRRPRAPRGRGWRRGGAPTPRSRSRPGSAGRGTTRTPGSRAAPPAWSTRPAGRR